MTTLSFSAVRQRAHPVGNAISALAVALIAVSLVSMGIGTERRAFAAGTLTGAVTFADTSGTITAGGSADFTVKVPQGAACQGSGASNYRWETFLVSASVDVGALTFGSGPNAVGGSFVSALFSADGEAVSTKFPGANPLGIISGIPQFSLPNTATPLPLGEYKIGVACQLSGAIQEYWSTTITVTANAADVPLGIAWTVGGAAVATTTTTTAATTTTGAVTTTIGGATTTTVRGATTTVASSVATSSTISSTTTSTLFGSGAGSTIPRGQIIVATGGAPVPMLVWAVLLLAFGRIIVLLGRPPRVLPPRA